MRRMQWLVVILVLSLSACQLGNGNTQQGNSAVGGLDAPEFPVYNLNLSEEPANMGQLSMQLGQLGPFHGRFTLEFDGNSQWTYQVDMRSDGRRIEYSLHIEGVSENKNPGDVRLMHNGRTNYMTGAGTGDFCVRFPDTFITEPLFLGPEDFIHLDEFGNAPAESGSEQIAGIKATRYTASTDNHRGWLEVVVNYWEDPATQAVLKYDFIAWGNDPLYQQGNGRVHGLFEVLEIGPQEIGGVAGCAIDFPLPDDASGIIHLPGIIQFNSSMGPVEMDSFYTGELESLGWERQEPQINAQTQDGVLEYRKDNQTVSIDVEPLNLQNFDKGFSVKIFLEE